VRLRATVALVVHAAVLGGLVAGLFEPFERGTDRTGLTAACVVAAHVATGALIARAEVLVLPIALCATAFAVNGAEALAWLYLIIALPVLLAATAAGWLVGRFAPRAAVPLGAAGAGVAIVVTGIATAETVRFELAPVVSRDVQRALVPALRLGNLCPGSELPRRERPALERAVGAVERELRKHGHWRVEYTYYLSDGPEEREQITVRQLAQEHLEDLRNGNDLDGRPCRPDLQRRLRAALDR
jgi:hypothetical protein